MAVGGLPTYEQAVRKLELELASQRLQILWVVDPRMRPDTVALVPARRPGESDAALKRRTVVIKDIRE